MVGAASDVTKFTIGNLRDLATGKESKIGREFTQLMRRYTPAFSSLWYTRAAYNRVALDQLQYLIDPEAHRNFREAEGRQRRDYDQEFYWRPGNLAPARAPQLPR